MPAFDMPQGEYTTSVDKKSKAEEALLNRLVLGLAAHPLSSCNPPPKELPDLLDAIIFHERRLKEQLAAIDTVGQVIVNRLTGLKDRLQELNMQKGHLIVQGQRVATRATTLSVEEREKVERKQRVLQKMCFQIGFFHWIIVNKVRGATVTALNSIRDILQEFLGEKHEHPGIGVANSKILSCTPDCNWYQKHGPYEWTKKPYSNMWWEEMNHTDWDWVRMRQHFEAVVSVQSGSQRALTMYEMLSANAKKFIPFWFWYEDSKKWTLLTESVKGVDGDDTHQIVVKCRFEKSVESIELDKMKREERIRVAREHRTKAGEEDKADDEPVPEVSNIGEVVIDETFIFNNLASKPALNDNSQHVRWLTWWGYEQWHAEMMKHQTQKSTAQAARRS